MAKLPTGTVTFLFTDIEGSTRLWEAHGEAMQGALARHDAILRIAVEENEGCVVKTTGDGIHAVFETAEQAMNAAVRAQVAFGQEVWGPMGQLRVRMGLHTGAAELRGGDYYGPTLNCAARLMAAGHGGQILVSNASEELVRDSMPREVALVDLGEHRFRDLGRPERTFQVVHPDLDREFPPLGSLDAVPSNLPLQRSEFIGRDEELAKITRLLDRSRVITLTGPGGVGKTRLALQVAADAITRFPDGVWFLDLAAVDDESLVSVAVAAALGIPERRHGSVEDAVIASLAAKQALLLFDNCEHVIDASARMADALAARCSHVSVLATSREALGIDGETTFAVAPLPLPNSDADEGGLLANDSVTLFGARAQAARHDFILTAENGSAVAEICRRLDGIPLAIELAAARVASMSPAAMLERIDERFRVLGQGRRTALARHQTLRGAVDWSYELLDTPDQKLFARLSVFAGGFTLEAAEIIATGEPIEANEVLDLLTGLVTKSMVQADDSAVDVRYRLLETLREYAGERLAEAGDVHESRQRHLRYYLELAETAAPHFFGADDSAWIPVIDAENDNLRAALVWARDEGLDDELVRITHGVLHYWWRTGRMREGLNWIEAALDTAAPSRPRVRAELMAYGGAMAINQAYWDRGQALLAASLKCAADAGEAPVPYALCTLALNGLVTNQPEEARGFMEQAVAAAHESASQFDLSECLSYQALMTALTTNDPTSVAISAEALQLSRQVGSDYLQSLGLQAAGIARYRTDPAAAIVLLEESIRGRAHSGVTQQALFFKGLSHLSLNQHQDAARDLSLALNQVHDLGEDYYQAMHLVAVAGLLATVDDADAAIRILACVARLREDVRIIGAPRDIKAQTRLRKYLEDTIDRDTFQWAWTAGYTLTLDETVALAQIRLAHVLQGAAGSGSRILGTETGTNEGG